MKLTTLEIKGFKSFAEKTTIHFNESITGIVGPNGCGKSNVIDSIRWVLGEQKTSMLRLDKMDNLIFNGTKKRKASSLAEVSLTFENTKNVLPTDYKTITVTRKLYRDGDSEYRLNDVPCRLKDISNLFIDTGVSSDSYAIIELGMVDEILNDRENSRRKLFEQAAGISKFKKRKKETFNKLKSTEADLERVQDLLFEIEGNLKTLESQARKAKRYKTLQEDYKTLALEAVKYDLYDYKERFKEISDSREREEDRLLKLNTSITEQEAALEKIKAENIDKEKKLSDNQKQLNELIANVGSRENERNVIREQIKFSEEKISQAGNAIEQGETQAGQLAIDIEKLQKEVDTEQQNLKNLEIELTGLKEKADEIRQSHQDIKHKLDEEQQTFSENEKQLFELEKQLAVNRSNKENLERELEVLEKEGLFRQQRLQELEDELKDKKKQQASLTKELEKLEKHEADLNAKIEKLNAALEEQNKKIIEFNRQIDSTRNEYELTKSLVENLEGFPESIKFLKKKVSYTKHAPLLSDIIYCDEEYRVAIESYLEPYLNYYVVDMAEHAVGSIHLLNEGSVGRANFFVLEAFQKYQAPKPLIIEGATPVSDVIELEEKYRELGTYLFENVFLVDDAEKFEGKVPKDARATLISKNGKIIKGKFSVSGGSIGLFEGKKIGRAKNLDKLQKKIKQLEKKLLDTNKIKQKQEEELEALNNATKAAEIAELKDQLNALNSEIASRDATFGNLQIDINKADEKNTGIKGRLKTLDDQTKEWSKTLEDIQAKQTAAKSSLELKDKDFVALTESLSEASGNYNQQNIRYHQQKNRIDAVTKDLEYKILQQEKLKADKKQHEETLSGSSKQMDELRKKLKELESSLLEGYENKETIEKQLTASEEDYFKTRGKINELEKELRHEMQNKNQVEQLITGLKDKINELKLQLSGLKERLQIEFKIDINDIINEEPEREGDYQEIKAKAERIKNRIENFGEINPMALEAFEEMKKRYDFIVSQKDDLEQAKVSLNNTIKEIEETAKQRFLDAFNKVREHFIEAFQSLFSEGDKCDLVLLDQENPLESKIEIIAKPKGKRPTVIDQLSGGEKTLTATALLFSLYLLKPAPFCVFDEVDAPLDDNNISKFNNIIRRFSENSQFIIVTHNKLTMSEVDVIYGVTMAEQGVSKVVPVDFRSLN